MACSFGLRGWNSCCLGNHLGMLDRIVPAGSTTLLISNTTLGRGRSCRYVGRVRRIVNNPGETYELTSHSLAMRPRRCSISVSRELAASNVLMASLLAKLDPVPAPSDATN